MTTHSDAEISQIDILIADHEAAIERLKVQRADLSNEVAPVEEPTPEPVVEETPEAPETPEVEETETPAEEPVVEETEEPVEEKPKKRGGSKKD